MFAILDSSLDLLHEVQKCDRITGRELRDALGWRSYVSVYARASKLAESGFLHWADVVVKGRRYRRFFITPRGRALLRALGRTA